jgi:hypothetical protein
MTESIFKDRRSKVDRRHDDHADGLHYCRRRVENRRRESAAMPLPDWWLNVNYVRNDR